MHAAGIARATPPASLGVRCAGLSAALLLGVGCTEPSFVSLGGNVARAALATDAGVASAFVPADSADAADAMLRTCGDEALGVPVTSSCEARVLVDCPSLGAAQYEIDDLLSTLLWDCLGFNDLLNVRFGDSGCAVGFGLDSSSTGLPSGAEACVANHLSAERYACAESVSCGLGTAFRVTR